jgi:hypothetical protein
MSELTYQQSVVYERLQNDNEKVLTSNEAIKSRASFVTGASTAVVGLITAAKYLPSSGDSQGFEYILLAMVCACSIAISWFAALVWKGGKTSIAGSADIDFLYEAYIGKNADEAYCNFLADLCQTKIENSAENTAQAKRLDKMICAFIVQLALLSVAIAWTSLVAYL